MDLLGDDDLDAAGVLLGGLGILGPLADGGDLAAGDAAGDEVGLDGVGAGLGEGRVGGVLLLDSGVPDRIGVGVALDADGLGRLDLGEDAVDGLLGVALERGLTSGEEGIAGDDEALAAATGAAAAVAESGEAVFASPPPPHAARAVALKARTVTVMKRGNESIMAGCGGEERAEGSLRGDSRMRSTPRT